MGIGDIAHLVQQQLRQQRPGAIPYGYPSRVVNSSGVAVAYGGQSIGSLLRPSESLMVTEKYGGGGANYILDNGNPAYYCCARPHNDGANIAFWDGHVKWMKMIQGDIGAPFNNGATGYNIYPPKETFWNVF